MMRIFVLHNHYQDKGGEDIVFAQEVKELQHNHQVQAMTFKNKKGWRGFFQFILYPWNVFAVKKALRSIAEFRPDIVHVHNTHYAIGPLLFRALQKRKIPVVLTLHNFRLLDPSASLFYRDKIYIPDLTANFPWQSVRLRVLDNSLLKTFWTALTYYLHKKAGTWKNIDRYLTFSNFAKKLIVRSSLDIAPDQIRIKPNFVLPPANEPVPPLRENHFIYIGRLSEEKGILPLLKAFSKSDFKLKIFGDGPLRADVLQYVERYPNISYQGFQSKSTLHAELCSCEALLVPSICYEGMPLNVLEAFSLGTPVLANRRGILEEMIDDGIHGFHFDVNDPAGTVATLKKWHNLTKDDKQKISLNCQKAYWDKYSPQKNVILLESIYQEVIKNKTRHE
jgi:glycosyltransferase involved in cell wall biosynthesis